MAQAGNSGRRASLDQKKFRAAGRMRGETGRRSGGKITRGGPDQPPGVGGAFGPGKTRASNLSKGGGGGGAGESTSKKTTSASGKLKGRGAHKNRTR